MPWMMVRTTTGERFLCQAEANLAEAVHNRKAIQIRQVYAVVTLSLMGSMGPSRMTALEFPDLQEGKPLESMMILPAAWYVMSDEQAEKEIAELYDSMAKAAEFRQEMARQAESQIVQARLAPQVGQSPLLGNLVRPPSRL